MNPDGLDDPRPASKARAVAAVASPRRAMRFRHFGPLVAFVVPTLVVGYGLLIPESCIAGVNQLTVGFASTLVGASVTYLLGVRSALRAGLD